MNDFSEQVSGIFQAAIEKAPEMRGQFLKEACDGNDSLRREVESLLDCYDTGFLEKSPLEEFAPLIADAAPAEHTNGKQIGTYKIIRQIGAGGMGEIYLAEDSKLKRRVALKFLSTQVTKDSEQLARFIREAQAVSALNHPNILTVYEIGVEDDVHFIATEFIDGKTLREILQGDEVLFEKMLSTAVQTAEALTAAHEAGVIHRDIKPENIMIRRDGYVKILDFGLAKLTETGGANADLEAETQMLLKTNPGLIMGTACYMSPEQTRGLADLDARTDVWSLGVVLFEIFAGRAPFEGNTISDMIASILKTETPALSDFVKDCPPELERIVTKALKKDRDERYQSMKDLTLDLKSLRRDMQVSTKLERVAANQEEKQTVVIPQRSAAVIPQLTAAATAKKFSLGGVLLILLGAALVGGAAWWYFGRGASEIAATTYKSADIVSWSSSPGEVYSIGSFSPDAEEIAFTSTKSGTRNIWIKSTDTGDALQITKDEFKNEKPLWSPNGKELVFLSARGNQAGIWRIPKYNGSPKLVAEIPDASVSLRRWSKTDQIYYESKNNLFAVEVNTGQIKQVTDFGANKTTAEGISVSPDEQQIAYISNDGEQWRVWSMPAGGGAPAELVASASEIKNTVWHPDNKRIFYSSKVDGTFQIFVTDVSAAVPRQITSADKDSFVLDASFDGSKILYGSAKEESDVWAVNRATSKETSVASDIASELWVNVSPDGKTVAYQSIKNLSQGDKIYNGAILIKQINSADQPVQLAADGFLPTWSPDGQKIAFMKVSGKKFQLAVIKPTGADQRILAESGVAGVRHTILPYNRFQQSDLSWSPDGSRIAYVSDENSILLVNADGSGNTALTGDSSDRVIACPLWSANGSRLAFSSKTNTTAKPDYGIWIADTATKNVRLVIQKNFFLRLIGWSETGKELLLASVSQSSMVGLQKEVSLLQVNIESGATREIGLLKDAYLFNIHLSPDKKTIAFVLDETGLGNIFTMPAAGGEAKKITRNNDPRIYFSSMSWAPDGGTIYFGKQTRYSLLSMLTNFE